MRYRGKIQKKEIHIIGLETRTRNQDERTPATTRIPLLWERFFKEQVAERVPHKATPAHMLEIYTDYESDDHGVYSVLLAYEVTDLTEVPTGMVARTLPASTYAVFTSDRGPLFQVVQQAWGQIWSMDEAQLGGQRAFRADFEVYHEGSQNPQDGEVDLYISLI